MTDSSTASSNTDMWDETYNPLSVLSRKYKEDPEQFMFMISVTKPEAQITEPLLPPKKAGDNRPTLVLDLDETLVHSFLNIDEYPRFDFHFQVDSDDTYIDVFCKIRPHLQEFLKKMAEIYELVVFTASQESYASLVINRIDPHGYIEHRLYRHHCTQYQGNYLKDLSILGRPISKTVIIDNSPLAFAFQPLNGIPCHSWTYEQDDIELFQLIPRLTDLARAPDLRVVLSETYAIGRLMNWLRSYVEASQLRVEEQQQMQFAADSRYQREQFGR